MLNIPGDVINYIAQFLDDVDQSCMICTCVKFELAIIKVIRVDSMENLVKNRRIFSIYHTELLGTYSCKYGYLDLFKYAMKKGYYGIRNGIMEACKSGHYHIISFILRHVEGRTSYIKIWKKAAVIAAKGNHTRIVELIGLGRDLKWDTMLKYACMNNNADFADQCIRRGAIRWNSGLKGACRGGHIDMARDMIGRGAHNLTECLRQACKYGHIQLSKYIIKEGAYITGRIVSTVCRTGNQDLFDYITSFQYGIAGMTLKEACKGNYVDMIRYVISKNIHDYDDGLRSACKYGNKDAVILMIEHGAQPSSGVAPACKYGRAGIVKILHAYGAGNWHVGFNLACTHGYFSICALIGDQMCPDCDWNLALNWACTHEDIPFLSYCISKGATSLNSGMEEACYVDNQFIVGIMAGLGADNWNSGLIAACRYRNIKLAEIMILCGATNLSSAYNISLIHGYTELCAFIKAKQEEYPGLEDTL